MSDGLFDTQRYETATAVDDEQRPAALVEYCPHMTADVCSVCEDLGTAIGWLPRALEAPLTRAGRGASPKRSSTG